MILVACMVGLLAACGGGDSGTSSTPAPYVAPATYGAIYLDIGTFYSGIIGSQISQAAANKAMMDLCKSHIENLNCVIILEFGENTCGAIATSATKTSVPYGVGTGSSSAIAEANATSACTKNGGISCSVRIGTLNGTKISRCNGTGVTSFTTDNLQINNEDSIGGIVETNESK